MSNILDYLIIGLIFAVVIALLLQLSGCSNQNNDEHMEETEQVNKLDVNQEALDLFYVMNKNKAEEISKNMPIYIKEIANCGRFQNEEENNPYSKQEIQAYQNDFFGFQSTINHASGTEMVDTVDKLNEFNMNQCKGQNIAEVYDKLTQNKFYCDNQHKIIPPQVVDEIQNTGNYLENGNSGQTYSRDNWQYESDSVNNGGNFYGTVKASDSVFDSNQVWQV